jgi:hypothetical protein
MDTIEKVDPRTLRELSFINAAWLYYIANAGSDDTPWIARLTFSRGVQVIRDIAGAAADRVIAAKDGAALGSALDEGIARINYYTGLEKQAVASIERIVEPDRRASFREASAPHVASLGDIGAAHVKHLRALADTKAKSELMKIVMPAAQETAWDREAATLIPKRFHFATLFLEEVPVSEWKEVRSSPHWWDASNWASASFWWVDGKRSLKEIKKLCELEADTPMNTFDLINYYKFLQKFKYIEFVEPPKAETGKKDTKK